MTPSPVLRAAGYQGPRSVHTRGLEALAAALAGEGAGPGWRPVVEADATTAGLGLRDLFLSVEAGERDLCYLASGYLTARVPELAVLDLPFTVEDRQAALAALDGEAGRILAAAVHRLTGFRVLAFWDNGVRHLSNRVRPLLTPADCPGLTIRTLDNAIYRDSLEALGFRVVVTDPRELRRALQSGEVDGQENPLTNLVVFDLVAHQPFVSLTGHVFGVALLVCGQGWYGNLDPERRAELDHAVEAATLEQRRLALREDTETLAALRAAGVAVAGPEAIDRAAFAAACRAPVARETARLEPRIVKAYLGG